jgi:1-acyl-sn-glycerol-3-phosphate acyltransferase
MAVSLERPVPRRLVTVTCVIVLFAVLTVLLPILTVAALIVDLVRLGGGPSRWTTLRTMGFGWFYLIGQIWALAALAATAFLSRPSKERATHRLQVAWARWNFAAVRLFFGLQLTIEGEDQVTPGPIVVLSRHASMIDTLLPAILISGGHGIRLRYVLKKELLLDPALDIAGHRLPNHFIDRGSGESATERSAIRALGQGLGPDEGVLIYPEGTRFSVEKRDRLIARFATRTDEVAEITRRLHMVLPPHPGGTLALLEGADADVVILAHHGLEGFATVADVWRGALVGSRISVRFWRIPRARLPEDRSAQVNWLYQVWAQVDEWVAAQV